MLQWTPERSRHAHHVAESGEDYIWILRDRQPVIDSPHRQHANRTARPMNQLNIFRKNIFQSEAIDGVSMAAAHFHHAVVAGSSESPNFLGRARNQFGLPKLINVS